MSILILRSSAGVGGGGDPYPAFRVPTGSDKFFDPSAGVDGSGSDASPWNAYTAARLQSLVAGQALFVKNGTFNAVDVRSLNSGTLGNEVTVANYPGHSPTINFATGGVPTGGGDYWDWRGLNVTCNDTGFDLVGNSQDSGSAAPVNHWRFIDMNTTKGSSGTTDNSGVYKLRSSGVDYIEIIRGSVIGPGGEAGNNRSGIWIDRVPHVKVIGTLLRNHNIPIYYKHNHQLTLGQVELLFKNLMITGENRGMLQCVAYAVYQNSVFNNCTLSFSDDGGDPAGDYNNIKNCTFLDTLLSMNPPQVPATSDLVLGAFGNILRDNVFAGSTVVWDNRYGTSSSLDQQTDTDYNGFGTGSSLYGRNGSFYSLSGYKSAFPTREIHSLSGTIVLAGGASPSATVPADWDLTGPSSMLTGSSTGGKIGVDYTKLLTAN